VNQTETMRLGVKLSPRPDGGLTVVAVHDGGSVASAGGKPGDVWMRVDGVAAAEMYARWKDGTCPRRPGIPIQVEVLREGERLVHRPMWRTDEPLPMAAAPGTDPERAPDTAASLGDEYRPPGPFSQSVMDYLATESSGPRFVTRDAAAGRYNPTDEIDMAVERAIYGR
jgi:predicted metalloprotease with PDZ domain